MSINQRYDFVFLYDVIDGNPNGDPDSINVRGNGFGDILSGFFFSTGLGLGFGFGSVRFSKISLATRGGSSTCCSTGFLKTGNIGMAMPSTIVSASTVINTLRKRRSSSAEIDQGNESEWE